jgi:hypothetical protein
VFLAHALSADLLAVTLAVQVVEFMRRSKGNNSHGYDGANQRYPDTGSRLR